jgi:hypothetical protein
VSFAAKTKHRVNLRQSASKKSAQNLHRQSQCLCFSRLIHKDNAVDLVDEGTTPPQKLVLRTVRAEYTKLAKIPLVSICVIRGSLCAFCAFCGQTKSV